jgi:phosphohistidine phosphatase
MPQLLIMRHAKSDWDSEYGSDHDRPLAPRGVKAAKLMGRFLAKTGRAPELVISSTAVRARTTAELAAESGDWGCEIILESALYGTHPLALIDFLAERSELPERVMVVGHEPTWSGLVAAIAGGGLVRMPTAAVACIDLAVTPWQGLAPGRGKLLWMVTPKLLKGVL